jgi:hypothetical protein
MLFPEKGFMQSFIGFEHPPSFDVSIVVPWQS